MAIVEKSILYLKDNCVEWLKPKSHNEYRNELNVRNREDFSSANYTSIG